MDFRSVVAHSLWILGVAVVVAAFSYCQWLAQSQRRRLSQVLHGEAAWSRSVAVGLLLTATGFLLMRDHRWWERVMWTTVLALAALDLWRTGRRR